MFSLMVIINDLFLSLNTNWATISNILTTGRHNKIDQDVDT